MLFKLAIVVFAFAMLVNSSPMPDDGTPAASDDKPDGCQVSTAQSYVNCNQSDKQ
ncbi:uncharacterized protein L969DRAFT_91742 [Mixia osmundae IAM 14324]|uniref:Uncharacterized protein n=1 Tax=Mixia osmundae (strain CBS 9802 / IAM 14324 / JCM 22182 / KY 12970) TaxID=764103 RepID=G7E0D5_MIXOS|nr:uncharacterized protein L969DRAFT_91742 [Mixia osmundae IAM 14324]KEI42287.1 hypothetical protein L969DRAFT_91742 [Mixia osmundae IAM 14324]GAA96295.1 hypothetical protein E5Q_02961 [Mixia osmundae IAM 14324]